MLKNYSGTEPNVHENRSTECVWRWQRLQEWICWEQTGVSWRKEVDFRCLYIFTEINSPKKGPFCEANIPNVIKSSPGSEKGK